MTAMKAAYIAAVGPPENIQYGELPVPTVGAGGALEKLGRGEGAEAVLMGEPARW
jgi:hypothetical protein